MGLFPSWSPGQTGPLTISTIFSPASVPAPGSPSTAPTDMVRDASGNIYLALYGDQQVIRLNTDGTTTVIAGTGVAGYGGDGGPATAARLYHPSGVAVDTGGNVFIVDTDNYRIRRVSPTGIITTVAGDGSWGPRFPGDGRPATTMALNCCTWSITVDAAGNFYIPLGNMVVSVAPSGVVTSVAGVGAMGSPSDGQPAKLSMLTFPAVVAMDAGGTLFIADTFAIYKVIPDGTIYKVPGSPTYPLPQHISPDPARGLCYPTYSQVLCIDSQGHTNVIAGATMAGMGGDGGPATSAILYGPGAMAADNSGDLYIVDGGNNRIRRVNAAGIINTVWKGGNAVTVKNPANVATDQAGNVYISDYGANVLWRLSPAGVLTTVAGTGVGGFGGDGSLAADSSLWSPMGVALDAAGNLYIADTANQRVRVVGIDGIIRTLAGTGMGTFSGDGGPARNATLYVPMGVAVDAAGSVFIADTYNNRIRRVAPDGVITTVAGTGPIGLGAVISDGDGGPATAAHINNPKGVAVDSAGNVYVADTGGSRIRRFTPGGTIMTVAGNGSCPINGGSGGDGGPATLANLCGPSAIALDSSTNLYIVDQNRIRRVNSAGIIETVAGSGVQGDSGDGGSPTSAQLNIPWGVAVDSAGILYIADTGNKKVKRVGPGMLCGVTLSSTQRAFDANAASGSLGVTLAPSACSYTASPDSAWLHVTGGSQGTGSGTVQYSVDANTSASPRLGNIVASATGANGTFSVLQSGTGCQFGPYQGTYNAPAAGGQGSIQVVASPAGCAAWVAGSDSPWLTITSGGAGTGGASIQFSFLMNTTGLTRTGHLTAGPQTFTIIQPSYGYSISGQVTFSGSPLSGVTVSLMGTQIASTTTDAAGNYGFGAVSVPGNYTITPSRSGYIFNPRTQSFNPLSGSQTANFTASLPPVSIAGHVALFGGASVTTVLVSLSGSQTGSIYVDQMGNYGFRVPQGGNYTVTAYRSGYTFAPASRSFNSVSADQTGNFSGAAALQFYPMAPCRVADTRSFTGPPGPLGPPRLDFGATRSFPVFASACGIPYSAVAYSLNVSAVPINGRLGYLTAWASGQPMPIASTLNSWDGRIVANAALVPAGNGAISIYPSDTTDVFFDINGYFALPGAGGLQFYPVAPCRVADTRSFTGPPGPLGPPSMAAGSTRSFPVRSSACGIPATAVAYSLNMSAVPGTNYLGYLSTWATGQPQPVVSTLNSWTGTIVSNAAIVPAGAGGAISVFVSDPTDVFFDINGYFAPPGPGGLQFYPVAPCRVADTRSFTGPPGPLGPPSMGAGASRSFPVLSSACGIPAAAAVYALNVTAAPTAGYLQYLTAWATGQPMPVASTLNSWTGTIVPNAALVPAGAGGAISIFASNPTDVFLDINGYFAP